RRSSDLSELIFQLVEYPVHALRLDLRYRLFVYPSAAAVPADPLPRLPQHVWSVDLVIQDSERPARRCLGRAVQLPLKYSHLFMRLVLSHIGSHTVRPSRSTVIVVVALRSRGINLLRRVYDPF